MVSTSAYMRISDAVSAQLIRLSSLEFKRILPVLFVSVIITALTVNSSLAPLAMAQGGDQVLYDGEPGSVPLADPTCQQFSGGDSIEAAHTGSYSFKNTPDPWHRPTMLLYCGGNGRPNLSGFDVIEFYFRAADPANPPIDPMFRIVTCYAASNEVPILNYVEGGAVDAAWRRVQIPTADLIHLSTKDWAIRLPSQGRETLLLRVVRVVGARSPRPSGAQSNEFVY